MEKKDELLDLLVTYEKNYSVWKDEEIISKVEDLLNLDKDKKSPYIFVSKIIDNLGEIEESKILNYFKDFNSDILIFCNLFKETGYESDFDYVKAPLAYFTRLYYKYKKEEIQENDLKYIILLALIDSIYFLKNDGQEKFKKVLLYSKIILLNFINLGILEAKEIDNNIKIELDFNEEKFRDFLLNSKNMLSLIKTIYEENDLEDEKTHIYGINTLFSNKANLLLKKIKEASI